VQRQPAQVDRAGEGGAVLLRRTARFEEGVVDPLDVDAAVLDRLDSVGDSISLRAAASGSARWLGSMNFADMA